ncbi:MAG: SDR family NAD(P)-dependent oxidoreductase, partial [Candidatus Marinimicrobia bacterium]|nr:SDR family NAD(P)-dependent oxidoreductase [Candidatus Neomarinimicrobiota bacterium]
MGTDLNKKVVLITGASAGIGKACAQVFAAAGCRLILTARRKERLQALAEELRDNFNSEVLVKDLDVRESEAVQVFVESLPAPFNTIAVLVNNAGLVIGVNKAHETPGNDVDTMLDTNVKGLLNMTRAVVPGMVASHSGHVINISSIAGHEAYPGGAVYCASKHAVNAITKSLRMDVVDTGIRVTAISPGLVETEFSMVRFKGDTEKAD